jgi:hypothetical protein
MLAARSQLGALVTFDQGAQAYLRGQLPCPPLDPDRLWDK